MMYGSNICTDNSQSSMIWLRNHFLLLIACSSTLLAHGFIVSHKLAREPFCSTLMSSATDQTGSSTTTFRAPDREIDRRRNLAIISHPDSGKTTMTEKLLLYGGALQQAGAVRQKAEQRSTASDFMEMEKERGISISSTVLNFDYKGKRVNILDTPGHADFSEDTYRALAAADNAVMLLDAAKGLEPQTRKLFEVCRMRSLPLFTFVNKMDRPALSPYEIIDQIEEEFGLESHPVLWPIGDGKWGTCCARAVDTNSLLNSEQPQKFQAIVSRAFWIDLQTLCIYTRRPPHVVAKLRWWK